MSSIWVGPVTKTVFAISLIFKVNPHGKGHVKQPTTSCHLAKSEG